MALWPARAGVWQRRVKIALRQEAGDRRGAIVERGFTCFVYRLASDRERGAGRNSLSAAESDRDVTRPVALVCTIAVGLLIGLQPASNAALSEHVSDLGAAFVSLV